MTTPAISPNSTVLTVVVHPRNNPSGEIAETHHLSRVKRIERLALFILFIILVVPVIVKGWHNVKQIGREGWNGVESEETIPVQTALTQQQIFNLDLYSDIQQLEKEVKELRCNVRAFDNLILGYPPLREACQIILQQQSAYIVPATPLPPTLNPSDPIDLKTKLTMEKNNLKHLLSEREYFFKQNPQVHELFQQALSKV